MMRSGSPGATLGDLPSGMHDLLAPAVREREREHHASVLRRRSLELLQDVADVPGEPLELAQSDQTDAVVEDLAALRQEELVQQPHQDVDLTARARPVLRRERVQREGLDPEAPGGPDHGPDAVAPAAMTLGAHETSALGPAAVAVEDD